MEAWDTRWSQVVIKYVQTVVQKRATILRKANLPIIDGRALGRSPTGHGAPTTGEFTREGIG